MFGGRDGTLDPTGGTNRGVNIPSNHQTTEPQNYRTTNYRTTNYRTSDYRTGLDNEYVDYRTGLDNEYVDFLTLPLAAW